jgi:hypothetical protein
MQWPRRVALPVIATALGDVSFKFRESTVFERTAIHEPRGLMIAGDPRASHASIVTVEDEPALLRALRATLTDQATPVVEALYDGSGFAHRDSGGMLTSSWGSHFARNREWMPKQIERTGSGPGHA